VTESGGIAHFTRLADCPQDIEYGVTVENGNAACRVSGDEMNARKSLRFLVESFESALETLGTAFGPTYSLLRPCAAAHLLTQLVNEAFPLRQSNSIYYALFSASLSTDP
jgi:hypothetical protein